MSSYLLYIEMVMHKESERVQECLDISTKKMLIDILNRELISNHEQNLLENEDFKKFIADQRVEDLRRLYELMKRVHLQQSMRFKWITYLKSRGEELLKDEQL